MAGALAAVVILGSTVAVTAAITAGEPRAERDEVTSPGSVDAPVTPPGGSVGDPPPATSLPVPSLTAEPADPTRLCDDPAVLDVLADGTDVDVVADGRAPFRCVDRSGPPLPIS